VSDSCPVASRLLDAVPLCRDRHDVSITALHRRLGRGARVRQWLIEERVKNLLTKGADGPRTLYANTHLMRKQRIDRKQHGACIV
jgi:hypothetical protein